MCSFGAIIFTFLSISKFLPDVPSIMKYLTLYSPVGKFWGMLNGIVTYNSRAFWFKAILGTLYWVAKTCFPCLSKTRTLSVKFVWYKDVF